MWSSGNYTGTQPGFIFTEGLYLESGNYTLSIDKELPFSIRFGFSQDIWLNEGQKSVTFEIIERTDLRNIAIIAHVDHGKTTLVDQLLRQSGTFRDNEQVSDRVMDSNDIEKERGITILAKNTAINYKDYKINILDTPGHADFGGEVERIMKMVDGVLLVVDAYEGTMPQTRFVLKKALEAGVKPIVAINKVDKPSTRINEVLDEVLELFIELGADDEQLEFPVVYVSGLQGTSSLEADLSTQKHTMDPVLDMIVNNIPGPSTDKESPLQFQPALLDYNDYVGRIGIGRVARGTVKVNEMVSCVRLDGSVKQFRIQKLLTLWLEVVFYSFLVVFVFVFYFFQYFSSFSCIEFNCIVYIFWIFAVVDCNSEIFFRVFFIIF